MLCNRQTGDVLMLPKGTGTYLNPHTVATTTTMTIKSYSGNYADTRISCFNLGSNNAGKGFIVAAGASLTIEGVWYSGCTTAGVEANAANTRVTIINSYMSGHGTASVSGGAVSSTNTVNATFINTVFTANRAATGGACYLLQGSMTAINCTFSNHLAGTMGGAIALRNSLVRSNFTRCTFANNILTTGSFNGGGHVALNGGWATFVDSTFTSGQCSGEQAFGGAFFVITLSSPPKDSDLVCQNCSVISSRTEVGAGAIAVTGASTVTLLGGRFIDSVTTYQFSAGGAIVLAGNARLFATGTYFANSFAYSGAVVSMQESAQAFVTDCVFADNKARFSGGVFDLLDSTELTWVGGSVTNSSAESGGALLTSGTVRVVVDNVTFRRGYAAVWGGFALTASTLPTEASLQVYNSRFLESSTDWGAAVLSAIASEGGSFDVPSALFVNCTFADNTGVIGSTFNIDEGAVITVINSTFTSNRAEFGAVAYVYATGQMRFEGSTFHNNSASSGGCFYVTNTGHLEIEDATFEDNFATENSAGVLALLRSTVHMTNVVAVGNEATEFAGFMTATQDSTVVLENVVLANNSASDYGGAIAAKGTSSLTCQGCTISGNCARSNGGGLHISGKAIVHLEDAVVSGNSAGLNGGGVFVQGSGTLTWVANATDDGSSVVHSSNLPATSSSALQDLLAAEAAFPGSSNVDAWAASQLAVSACADNLATIDGGCVAMFDSAEFSALNVVFKGNRALASGGHISADHGSKLVLSGSVLVDGQSTGAGGAISVESSGVRTSACVSPSSNNVGEASTIIVNSYILNNTAQTSGAGLAVVGGHHALYNVRVSGNVAAESGGGLHLSPMLSRPQSELQVNATLVDVESNTASQAGGGVSATFSSLPTSWVQFVDSSISSNTALMGGGLYLPNFNVLPILLNTVVQNNQAAQYGAQTASPGVQLAFDASQPAPGTNGYTGGEISVTIHLLDGSGAIAAVHSVQIEVLVLNATDDVVFAGSQIDQRRLDGTFTSYPTRILGEGYKLLHSGVAQLTFTLYATTPGTYKIRYAATGGDASISPAEFAYVVQPCTSSNQAVVLQDGNPVCASVFDQNKSLRFGFMSVAIIGEACAILLVIFVIRKREEPIVKAASPKFCLIVIFGCMLEFALIPTLVPDLTPALCVTHIWIGHLGFAVAFGALFAKTHRIAAIFNNKNLARKLRGTSDSFLMSRIAIVVSAVSLYLLVWSVVDKPDVVGTTEVGETISVYYMCKSSNDSWSVGLYALEAVGLLYGCWLAWQVRNAPSRFRESKFIVMAVWNILVVSIIILPLNYALNTDNPDTQFMFTALGILLATFGTLGLIFIPKMYGLVTHMEPGVSLTTDKPTKSTSNKVVGYQGSFVNADPHDSTHEVQHMAMSSIEDTTPIESMTTEQLEQYHLTNTQHITFLKEQLARAEELLAERAPKNPEDAV
ncbi:hypothetical protein, variant [Capsaspora owczarzaki ATCC 30864]|nr:hypothetical protein, variant [Capsaspora owczarzaki ATCC 30864]